MLDGQSFKDLTLVLSTLLLLRFQLLDCFVSLLTLAIPRKDIHGRPRGCKKKDKKNTKVDAAIHSDFLMQPLVGC